MSPRFRFIDWLLVLVVLGLAGGARYWYLQEHADEAKGPGRWFVQDPPVVVPGDKDRRSETDVLVANLNDKGLQKGFRGYAPPFYATEETTAHVAPGYPMFRSLIESVQTGMDSKTLLRWLQAGLGALTAMLYYFLAHRAFTSTLVALLAGLFSAFNPFWVINTAEMNDGVLVTFLLALALSVGARAGDKGGALTSLLYAVALAALALTRAALLPFALVAMLWYLLRCRQIRLGWMYATIAFLGFGAGMSFWCIRNYQEFQQPVPIVDTAWWHLWVGNHPGATGGPLRPEWGPPPIKPERLAQMRELTNEKQPKRYEALREDVLEEVDRSPGDTVRRRASAGLFFLTGEAFASDVDPTLVGSYDGKRPPAELQSALAGTLFGLLLLAFLGWRWSYIWRRSSMPLQLAIYWIPIPYILAHAELLSGPRLPWDGPLICLSALALVCLIPGLGSRLLRGQRPPQDDDADYNVA